jgi:hypothetical protein
MRAIINLKCENCGREFERELSEFNRCRRKGFAVSCGRTCGAVLRNQKHSKGNLSNFKGLKRKPDEFSPFRFLLNACKSKAKQRKINFNLSLEDIISQWTFQNGKCAYTNFELKFPSESTQYKKRPPNPLFASIDRIDSSKGYTKDNVEFVCISVNYAKNGFSKEQMISFFNKIKSN